MPINTSTHIHIGRIMIRPAIVTDAPDIISIYNHFIRETTITFETVPLSVETMGKRISEISSHGFFLVYESHDGIIGYCYAHPWKERAAFRHTWETTVYISPNHQGKGIGTKLMKELIRHCQEKNCHSLVACITADNEPSCKLHQQLGFHKVSHFTEVGYKFGQWLDTVDYELTLPAKP